MPLGNIFRIYGYNTFNVNWGSVFSPKGDVVVMKGSVICTNDFVRSERLLGNTSKASIGNLSSP